MVITREWCMPNSRTFQMKPIRRLIEKYINNLGKDSIIIDPFANESKYGTVTNDIDSRYDTNYHMEGTEFLKLFEINSVDMVLYDPPYSPRQLAECYKANGLSVTMTDTQSSYWTKQKKIISQIVRRGGYCISFGWNSCGIGINNEFEIVEILLLNHGAMHNDTICTVEKKKNINFIEPNLK